MSVVEEFIFKRMEKQNNSLDRCFREVLMLGRKSAQQSVRLTALRRWLAVSIFINVILLAVVLFFIGGG